MEFIPEERMTVEISKHDVYGDGKLNTAVVRVEKFHFKDDFDLRQFIKSARRATGVIEVKRIK